MKQLNILRKPLLLAAFALAVLPIAARPRHMHRQAPAAARQFCPAAKAPAHHRPSLALHFHSAFGAKQRPAAVLRKAQARHPRLAHHKLPHPRHFHPKCQRPH